MPQEPRAGRVAQAHDLTLDGTHRDTRVLRQAAEAAGPRPRREHQVRDLYLLAVREPQKIFDRPVWRGIGMRDARQAERQTF